MKSQTDIDIAVLKENAMQNNKDHQEIKQALNKIELKIDKAIEEKADKTDLKDLRDKGWAVILAIIVAFIGLIVTALKVFIK